MEPEDPFVLEPDGPPLAEACILIISRDDQLFRQLDTHWVDFNLRLFTRRTVTEAEPVLSSDDLDIVLLHAEPSGDDPLGLCGQVKRTGTRAAVYVVQSAHTVQEQLQCLRLGCEGFIPFPTDPSQIAEIVTGVITRKKRIVPKVLWIDDDAPFLRLYSNMLAKAGFQVITNTRPLEVFALLANETPDILLLDYEMPEANGLELIRMIRLKSEYRFLPIIMVTANPDSSLRKKLLDIGADDFLRKPFESADLVARIQAKVVKGDILRSIAGLDPLTQLSNQKSFMAQLTREFNRGNRHDRVFSLVIMDVDGFSHINQKYSFAVGDEILRELALRFRERFRKSDILCRFGGDEFAVVLAEASREAAGHVVGEILRMASELAFHGPGAENNFSITLCAGITSFPHPGATPQSMVAWALSALKSARRTGPGSLRYFPLSE